MIVSITSKSNFSFDLPKLNKGNLTKSINNFLTRSYIFKVKY